MKSKLARSTVEEWQREGLAPAFDDIVQMNALGLAVERNSTVTDFAAVPRAAFLGDAILWEPSIRKRTWIDSASQIMAPDYETRLAVTAYALNTPDECLPKLDSVKRVTKAVEKFRDEILAPFAESQIIAAIEYALTGADPREGEDVEIERDGEPVDEVPSVMTSAARNLLAQAYAAGIGADVTNLTLPALDSLLALASMWKGADVLKGAHADAVGRFYVAAGRIKSRLLAERDKSKQNPPDLKSEI